MGRSDASVGLTPDDVITTALAHYGVKGMKWGVRKRRDSGSSSGGRQERHDNKGQGKTASTKKIAKLDKRFERSAKSLGVWIDVHNGAATAYNAMDVGRINNSPKYKNLDFNKPSKLRDEYHNEHANALKKRLDQAAVAQGTNASGTRKLKVVITELGDGNFTFDVTTEEVKHADGDTSYSIPAKVDAKGMIIGVEVFPKEMSQDDFDEMTDEFLEHYGIKGMKWGVRRRRGSDGLVEKSGDVKNAEAAKAKIGKKGNTDALSNKELQALVTRMNLEQQFSKLNAGNTKKTNPALKFASDLLINVGKQQANAVAQQQATKLVANLLKNRG